MVKLGIGGENSMLERERRWRNVCVDIIYCFVG